MTTSYQPTETRKSLLFADADVIEDRKVVVTYRKLYLKSKKVVKVKKLTPYNKVAMHTCLAEIEAWCTKMNFRLWTY